MSFTEQQAIEFGRSTVGVHGAHSQLLMHDQEQRNLLVRKDAEIARLQLEAQSHAQEARTANATIAEIYQVVSGATGEPGNWHGAEPVRTRLVQLQADLDLVLGEAVWAMELSIDLSAAGLRALFPSLDEGSMLVLIKNNRANNEDCQRADAFLNSPLVQSYRARQRKEG